MRFRLSNVWPTMILLFTLGSLTAACEGENALGPENIYIADEADNGQTVTMSVGDALQVMLEEDQSTGTVWSIVTNDEAVLRLSDNPAYEVSSDAQDAGGMKAFVFESIGPGTSVLRMVNARSQATAVEPAATFELTVQVGE